MRSLAVILAAILLTQAAVPAASAQSVVRGRVLDDSTGAVIGGVDVELLSSRGARVGRTVTDQAGRFTFSTRERGWVRLTADRMGYEGVRTPRFELERGDTMDVEVRLLVSAVLLTPLEVIARSRLRPSAVLDGFYARLRSGVGHYLTREDIELRSPFYLTDLLATVPGVRLTSARGGGRSVYMQRALPRAEGCPVQVFVDGVLMSHRLMTPGQDGGASLAEDHGFTIDELVSPSAVEGIEVYRGFSTVPPEFLNQDARCGVIAIWTRRGGPSPRSSR